jgi:putative transposase
VKYAFIIKHVGVFPVSVMCSIFGVSRSGFYVWKTTVSTKNDKRAKLLQAIKHIHQKFRRSYGSPRIWRELRVKGMRVSKRVVEQLMREHGIKGKKQRRFKVTTTDSKHNHPISPNLVARDFDRGAVNRVWLSDITYLPTASGWAYLATVMDAHTRKIVGWSIAEHMRVELVRDALLLAVGREQPPAGMILHSDRGSQYASHEYRQLLAQHGLLQSMSRRGNCWDNAPMESFFDTLKTEHVYDQRYRDVDHARQQIFEWIEVFYNRQRMHSSLGYLSPACFENRAMANAA